MYGESPQSCSSATGWLSRPSRARSRDHQLGPRWRDAQLTSPSERMGTRCCTVTGNQSPRAPAWHGCRRRHGMEARLWLYGGVSVWHLFITCMRAALAPDLDIEAPEGADRQTDQTDRQAHSARVPPPRPPASQPARPAALQPSSPAAPSSSSSSSSSSAPPRPNRCPP